MLFTNVDVICRRWLLAKGLSNHFYLEALIHCTAAIRELSFDSMQIINSVICKLNSYNAIDLPTDFTDDIGVSLQVGGLLQPVPKNNAISPLRNVDPTGQFVPYTNIQQDNTTLGSIYGISPSWLWFWNINDWGEPTGRFFGANGGANRNGYKLIRERRQIQFTQQFTSDEVVLMYISDGQNIDNASQVDSLAQACIESYISWKSGPNADMKDSYEANTFYNEKRLFRARKDSLTVPDIKNIIRKNTIAAIKN